MRLSKMREWLRRPGVVAVLVGLAAFCVYLRTLAPGCTAGDGPELATAMYELGVAHPTGYPLYTMLGHFFMVVFPFGTPIWKSNLLSAISAACAVGVLFLVAKRVARRTLPAAVATLLFAFGLTFWSQAVITEVYAFHILLLVSTLYCLLTWDKTGDRRWLLATALCVGLSLTHHLTSIFTLPGVLYYALTSRHRGMVWRNWWRIGGIVAGCLLLYIYLPIAARGNAREIWGDPSNWRNFYWHISGAQYRSYVGVKSAHQLWLRLLDYFATPVHDIRPGYLLSEFAPSILWLAIPGLWSLIRKRARLFGLTAIAFVLTVGWSLMYGIPDLEVFYLGSYVSVALWIAEGIRVIATRIQIAAKRGVKRRAERRRILQLAGTALIVLPIFLVAGNLQANDKSKDRISHGLAVAMLDWVKPRAVVIGMADDTVFPLLYVRYVEGRRPDVTIIRMPEILLPDHVRGVERLQSADFRVNVPPTYFSRRGQLKVSYILLRQVLLDNLAHTSIYLYDVPADLLRELTVNYRVIPGLEKVGPPMTPLLQVTDKPSAPIRGIQVPSLSRNPRADRSL